MLNDCVPACDETLEPDDPNQPQDCRFPPKDDEPEVDDLQTEQDRIMEEFKANTTEDLEQKMTEFNVDPMCEFHNKTKHVKKNFWVNDEAERLFKAWFETKCYFSKTCSINTKEIAEFYQEKTTEMPTSAYAPIRIDKRFSPEIDKKPTPANRLLQEGISEELETAEAGQKEGDVAVLTDNKETRKLTFFDMVSDSCKMRMNDF